MRTVLFWKRADVIVQLLAILIPIALAIIENNFGYIILIYFSAGVVQLISVIVNRSFLDKFLRKPGRLECEIATLALICMIPLAFLVDILTNIYGFALLFLTPVLSIAYIIVCWNEMELIQSIVKRRELW